MDNQNMVRILQNMIDEATENMEGLAAAFEGYENQVNVAQRRADLAEAVKLVEELSQPAPAEQGEGQIFPRQIKGDGDGGWTIKFDFLRQIDQGIDTLRNKNPDALALDEYPSLESIEAVLLATESFIASRPQPEAKDARELIEWINNGVLLDCDKEQTTAKIERYVQACLASVRNDIEDEVRQDCANRRQLERCILARGSLASAREQGKEPQPADFIAWYHSISNDPEEFEFERKIDGEGCVPAAAYFAGYRSALLASRPQPEAPKDAREYGTIDRSGHERDR